MVKVGSVKFLGLTVHKQLNWNDHVNCVLLNVSQRMYALRQIVKLSCINTLKQIYFAFVESHISFGLSLYEETSASNLHQILVSHKKAILKLGFQDSVKKHFQSLGFCSVYGLYIYQLLIHIRIN